jgi:hypothetical protein
VSGLVTHRGVHVPACASLDEHIAAAHREVTGTALAWNLDKFIDKVREDWAEEQIIADGGDEAVIAFWRQVERDHMRLQADLGIAS